MEDPQYIRERQEAHQYTISDEQNYRVSAWRWLVRNGYDIFDIGRAAYEPLRDQVCERWARGDRDVVALAGLLDRASASEMEAYANALEEHLRTLSPDERSRIEQEIAEIQNEHGATRAVDRAGLAADVPNYYADKIERMCERLKNRGLAKHEQPEPRVVVLGDTSHLTQEELEKIVSDAQARRAKKPLNREGRRDNES